jgi:hypothetical protein
VTTGRDVSGAAVLVIVAAGAIGLVTDHRQAAPSHAPAPKPAAAPALKSAVVMHTVTRVVHYAAPARGGWPMSGWELMVAIVVIAIIAGGVAIAIYSRRPQ